MKPGVSQRPAASIDRAGVRRTVRPGPWRLDPVAVEEHPAVVDDLGPSVTSRAEWMTMCVDTVLT